MSTTQVIMEFLYFINNSKWLQDLVPTPILLDPVTLGWRQLEDGHYVPEVSKVLAAPEAMVELVKCSCVAISAVEGALVKHII